MELTHRLRAWTYRQQLLDASAADPIEALRGVIAVYSSQPTAPLALLARCSGFGAADFLALEQRRRAVRIPAMRGSVFLAPVESAARIFAATRVPLELRRANLVYAGVDLADYERLKPRLLELTREPVDARALETEVKSGATLSVLLRTMSREGLILRTSTTARSDQWLYVATEAWLGRPLENVDRDDALGWLAAEYLRAFGPARVEDFAWWAALSKRDAKASLDRCATVDVGDGLLLLEEFAAAFAAVEPLAADATAVLPKWDSYSMAYERGGRGRLVDGQNLTSAYSSPASARYGATLGDGLPLLLRAGRAVATWRPQLQGRRLQVTLQPFAGEQLKPEDYTGAFAEIGRLLDAPTVTVALAAS